MEVTKEGSVPSREEFFKDGVAITCEPFDTHDRQEHCGAELKVVETDLVPRYWEASHSVRYYFVTVCPRCGSDCRLILPDVIHQELMTGEMRNQATFDGFSDAY